MALTTIRFSATLYRENLRADRIYVDPDGNALHSPDGTGAVYHESLAEAVSETGLEIVEHVTAVDLDHEFDLDFDGN